MTDPAIMRLSKGEYEKRFGPAEKGDKTGTEWFDRIIDHHFVEIDVGHEDQSNFKLGTPPAPAGVCLFHNNYFKIDIIGLKPFAFLSVIT